MSFLKFGRNRSKSYPEEKPRTPEYFPEISLPLEHPDGFSFDETQEEAADTRTKEPCASRTSSFSSVSGPEVMINSTQTDSLSSPSLSPTKCTPTSCEILASQHHIVRCYSSSYCASVSQYFNRLEEQIKDLYKKNRELELEVAKIYGIMREQKQQEGGKGALVLFL